MATWKDYWRQATLFWEVAESVHDAPHANQAASNAILAAIAANDALCLYLGGRRARADDHASAVALLRQITSKTEHSRAAAGHAEKLAAILQMKNEVQYYGAPITPAQAGRVMKQVRRLLDWVQSVLPPAPIA
ncbi:hypothetical protein LLH23_08305 [bacterium]|nr:hypothetical protein [bacterium]